jgi:hypothetical protein
LETVLASETAGDPMGRRPKAKRSTLRQLSKALKDQGHPASPPTVAKLLRKMKYSPKDALIKFFISSPLAITTFSNRS